MQFDNLQTPIRSLLRSLQSPYQLDQALDSALVLPCCSPPGLRLCHASFGRLAVSSWRGRHSMLFFRPWAKRDIKFHQTICWITTWQHSYSYKILNFGFAESLNYLNSESFMKLIYDCIWKSTGCGGKMQKVGAFWFMGCRKTHGTLVRFTMDGIWQLPSLTKLRLAQLERLEWVGVADPKEIVSPRVWAPVLKHGNHIAGPTSSGFLWVWNNMRPLCTSTAILYHV